MSNEDMSDLIIDLLVGANLATLILLILAVAQCVP